VRDGDVWHSRFASEVNGKCLGASKSELLEEESGGCGSCVGVPFHIASASGRIPVRPG
jgi:hypothetical protein